MAAGLRRWAPVVAWLLATAGAAELRTESVQAFNHYVRAREDRMDARVKGARAFLWVEEQPERMESVRQGQILTQPSQGTGDREAPRALIHDWIGAVFIPGATLPQVLALVQDYSNHKKIYQPEVIDSKTLSHHGDSFTVYLRVLKKKVLTVVLDTDHSVQYFPLGNGRCYSRSYSTRIVEVQNPGKPDEHILPPGQGHGFLWRLNSYWRFEQSDGGVYVECEAISLTRDVPTGLSWLINPIIRNLPRESLVNTLRATRTGVLSNAGQ